MRVDIAGENEEMRRSFAALAFAMLLAVLLVYMILAAEFESLVHPYTPVHKLKTMGTVVMERGKGVNVYDTHGRGYIEGMSGLWCAGLGFGDEEMIEAATEQMRSLPFYHIFGAKSTEPAIE